MVARRWPEVRKVHAEAVAEGRVSPWIIHNAHNSDGRVSVLETARVRCLAEVRKMYGHVRQCDVATLMGVSRPRVSKLESGNLSHIELGTIQSYVAALGGNLRVVADFGDSTVELSA